MKGSREGFGNDKPFWKQRRGHLLQFPDHKAMEKENSRKNLGKTKEKERAKNQAVTVPNQEHEREREIKHIATGTYPQPRG